MNQVVQNASPSAWVAKLVDAPDSKSGSLTGVSVRVRPQVPFHRIMIFEDRTYFAKSVQTPSSVNLQAKRFS